MLQFLHRYEAYALLLVSDFNISVWISQTLLIVILEVMKYFLAEGTDGSGSLGCRHQPNHYNMSVSLEGSVLL